jgi:hypothetical protein
MGENSPNLATLPPRYPSQALNAVVEWDLQVVIIGKMKSLLN